MSIGHPCIIYIWLLQCHEFGSVESWTAFCVLKRVNIKLNHLSLLVFFEVMASYVMNASDSFLMDVLHMPMSRSTALQLVHSLSMH